MRKIGELLLARPGYAATAALIFTLLPMVGVPFGFLATIIVGLITLCKGPKAGLFVLAWVALPGFALLYLRRFNVIDSILIDSIVIWLLAYVLRRLGSWRWVFEIATLIGVVIVGSVHLFYPNIEAWWTTLLTKHLSEIQRATSWRLTGLQSDLLIKNFAPIATGAMVLIGLFWMWLTLLLARWWQTTIYFPGRLRDEFIGVRNRFIVTLIVLLGFIGFLLKLSIVVDVFPVLLFPLMMGGLSFLHYVSEIKRIFFIFLIFIYLGLLFLPLIVVIALAAVGMLDSWFNFRRFFKISTKIKGGAK